VGKRLLPLVEYGLLAFIVVGELCASERARKLAARVLAAAVGVALLYGAVHYFGSRHAFFVGSFFGERSGGSEFIPNRNAFGAFLAVAVPFFAVLALSADCWKWRAVGGGVAALGTLLAATGGAVLGLVCGVLVGGALAGRLRAAIAAGALLVLLGLGGLLPRGNLTAALDSVRAERTCPKTGEKLLAMRYLRAGAEINVLRAPLRKSEPEGKLFFGLGPGGYDRIKPYRPSLGEREAGETDKVENYDALADEPGTFNLFGVAGAEMGILGVLGFVWFFAFCAGGAVRAWREADRGSLTSACALGALAAVVGAAVASPWSSVWIRGSGPLLAVLAAMAQPKGASPVIASDRQEEAEGSTS
jgi:O-antigen ligase